MSTGNSTPQCALDPEDRGYPNNDDIANKPWALDPEARGWPNNNDIIRRIEEAYRMGQAAIRREREQALAASANETTSLEK
ncbi:hypothetical protein IPL44_03175 [Candidatus Saccharibacteria bacterium]|nr:MAG: hypothetical protein IPL44_03175 [Candidatus Saccharibacteria bacterium]